MALPLRTSRPGDGGEDVSGAAVAGAELLAHVLDDAVEREGRRRVGPVRQNQLLEAGDDLVIGHREDGDVETEHPCHYLPQLHQLEQSRIWMALGYEVNKTLYATSIN